MALTEYGPKNYAAIVESVHIVASTVFLLSHYALLQYSRVA